MDDNAVQYAGDDYSHKSPFRLPAGWRVKEVIRGNGFQKDKYYIEPGTGVKFRSLKDVERRINGEIAKPRRRGFNLDYSLSPGSRKMIVSDGKSSGSYQKNISTEIDQNSSFNTPPTKINWVLASPGGDMWNPFIGEKLVVESVKQQWDKRFMFMIGNQDLD